MGGNVTVFAKESNHAGIVSYDKVDELHKSITLELVTAGTQVDRMSIRSRG